MQNDRRKEQTNKKLKNTNIYGNPLCRYHNDEVQFMNRLISHGKGKIKFESSSLKFCLFEF